LGTKGGSFKKMGEKEEKKAERFSAEARGQEIGTRIAFQ